MIWASQVTILSGKVKIRWPSVWSRSHLSEVPKPQTLWCEEVLVLRSFIAFSVRTLNAGLTFSPQPKNASKEAIISKVERRISVVFLFYLRGRLLALNKDIYRQGQDRRRAGRILDLEQQPSLRRLGPHAEAGFFDVFGV